MFYADVGPDGERRGSHLCFAVNDSKQQTVDGYVLGTQLNLMEYVPPVTKEAAVSLMFEDETFQFKIKQNEGVFCNVEKGEIFCNTWR